jgi:hypothetical protein
LLDELKAERDLKQNDPINFIGGAFTPVEDYINLNALRDSLETDFAVRYEALRDNAIARAFHDNANPTIIPWANQQPNFLGEVAPTKAHDWFLDSPVDEKIEKALPKSEAPMTAREALDHTPVVVLDGNPYKELVDTVVQSLGKAAGSGNVKVVGILQAKLKVLQEKAKIASKIMRNLKAYSAAFQQVLGPDTKLVLTAQSPFVRKTTDGQTVSGQIMLSRNTPLKSGKLVNVAYIFTDIDALATEIFNNKNAKVSDGMHIARRQLFETINHELGHMITANALSRIYSTIVDPNSTPAQIQGANRVLNVLLESYKNWLIDAAGKSHRFLLESQFALDRATQYTVGALTSGDKNLLDAPMTAKGPKGWDNKYLLSFDEFFAEMTSRLATQGALADPIMTRYFSAVLPQYKKLFEHYPAWAQSEYGHDWHLYLSKTVTEYKVKQALEAAQSGGSGDIIKAIRKGIPGFDPEKFAGLEQHLDRFDKLISYGFNLIQLAKENPHIEGLQTYLKAMAAWAEYQRNFQADANEVYKSWRNLGKLEAAQLSTVLFDEALSRKLTDPVQLTKLLSAEAQSVYKQVREQLAKVLEEMRATALQDLHRTILDNEELLNTEVQKVNEDFDKMTQQGYFPFIRFGKYTITARAKEALTYNGNTYKKGELISFPAFESQKERDEVLAQIRTELGVKANVASGVMRETDFVIQGMPRSLLRALRNKLEASGNFTSEQAHAFEAVAAESAPFRNFQKHMLKKKGIHGYSEDALRSFAAYIRGAAGHISRVKFNDDIRSSVDLVQQSVEIIKELGGRSDERQEIRHWLDRHFSYVMNPGNELAVLRGIGFVHYLGFNIKSAAVNLTQLLTTVGPYLAARYGDTHTLVEMNKATWTLKDWVLKRKQYLSAMDKLDKGTANQAETSKALLGRMIARGMHEGWLDQSLATELAIAASENNLDRGLYLPTARRWWHNVSRWSALPFHLVEKLNRYITAISAFNLEMKASGSYEKAVLAAREANWSANYENARWNRPEFMRGKKSAFFLFGNYLQNTLYFATRDPGALRYWLSMLVLAGVMGLPGSDDIADLADFAATYLNRLLGLKNPKVQIRVELREKLEELGANPDLILHGLSQDSFGLGHVGELAGIPIPHLDLSRSVGMSDVIPATEIPGMMLQNEPNDILVAAATEMAGASGSLVEQYYKSALSNDPDSWKRAEKLLPLVAARNLSKATRMALRGAETTQNGNVIAEFDPYSARTAMELFAQGLGFQPSSLTLGWERQIAAQENIQYYKVQQEILLKQMNFARWQQDREAVADMLEAVRKYNQQVPMPEMSITVDTMKDSFKSFLEKRVVSGMGLEAEKKYRRLREQTEKAFPNPMGTKDNLPENP